MQCTCILLCDNAECYSGWKAIEVRGTGRVLWLEWDPDSAAVWIKHPRTELGSQPHGPSLPHLDNIHFGRTKIDYRWCVSLVQHGSCYCHCYFSITGS